MIALLLSVLVGAATPAPSSPCDPGSTAPTIESVPWCWPCALFGIVGVLVPDRIVFGAGGTICPPGDGLCSIEWLNPPTNDPPFTFTERMALASTNTGEIGLWIPDLSKCSSVKGGQFVQQVAYTIPSKLATALKIQSYIVKAGPHQVRIQGNEGFVLFKK